MTARGPLREVIAYNEYLLFDFDGAVCDLFAGLPAPKVAAALRETVIGRGVEIPVDVETADDPFDILRFAATVSRELAEEIEAELTKMETRATESASATPHAREVLDAARRAGYGVALVSNNSRQAVTKYLTTSDLAPCLGAIVGRTEADPRLLKPRSHLITQALKELGAQNKNWVLIGDSLSDIDAAHDAGGHSIGYVDEPDIFPFESAGVDAIITSMGDLIPAIEERPTQR